MVVSLRDLSSWLLRTLLTPEDLAHERLELIVGNFSSRGSLDLRKHLSELVVRQVLALSAEGLLEICLCDETRIVNIEMVERKSHIGFRDGPSAIDGDCEELTVVDLTVSVKVDAFEDLINLVFRHVQFIEGGSDLAEFQSARAIGIERSECVSQLCEIECASVDLIDQEGERGNLQALRLSEVLNASQDHHLVRVEELRVVARVVFCNIVRGEPGVC